MGVGAVLRPSRWGGSLSASASRPAPTQWAATADLSRTSRQGGSSRSIGRFSTTVSPATVRRRLQGEAAPEQHRHQQPEQPDDHQDDLHRVEVEPRAGVDVHGKVKIAPRTNRKMLKPIPTASPPRTLQGCRQGCYRQAVPLSEERRRLSGRYDQASATTRR